METVFSERRSELEVVARRTASDGVVELTLADPTGVDLPAWTPGAHIDVLFDESLVRQYSLCGSPADVQQWHIAVLLERSGRGGSERAHGLQVGDRVSVRGPRNHFALLDARRYVFIAGGIGITPIRPMVEEAAAAGSDWQLHYGGRTRASMAFLPELEAHGEQVVVWPEDERGLLPLAQLLARPGEDDVLVYCCGPEPLLAAVEELCAAWPPGSLRLERFTAKQQPENDKADDGFVVVCQRPGVTITVPPEKSILDTLDENGISVLSSCQEGVCGTCETRVLEGVPDHRDSLLTKEERESNEYMMICVSRAQSERLVLDL